MFREMRRIKQKLSLDECRNILLTSNRAVVSLIGEDNYPYGIPINFTYDVEDNAIYIHGAKEGHKIDAIKKCNKVCFTTWLEIGKIENGFEVESVIIFGKAIFIDDIKTVEKQLWNIGNKYHSDKEYTKNEVNNNLDRVQIIKIEIEHITGKHINES